MRFSRASGAMIFLFNKKYKVIRIWKHEIYSDIDSLQINLESYCKENDKSTPNGFLLAPKGNRFENMVIK